MRELKRKIALFMAVVLSVSIFGQTGTAAFAAENVAAGNEEIALYDKDVRTDLDADEVATAEDINVLKIISLYRNGHRISRTSISS